MRLKGLVASFRRTGHSINYVIKINSQNIVVRRRKGILKGSWHFLKSTTYEKDVQASPWVQENQGGGYTLFYLGQLNRKRNKSATRTSAQPNSIPSSVVTETSLLAAWRANSSPLGKHCSCVRKGSFGWHHTAAPLKKWCSLPHAWLGAPPNPVRNIKWIK